jgi:hypothetical protein
MLALLANILVSEGSNILLLSVISTIIVDILTRFTLGWLFLFLDTTHGRK